MKASGCACEVFPVDFSPGGDLAIVGAALLAAVRRSRGPRRRAIGCRSGYPQLLNSWRRADVLARSLPRGVNAPGTGPVLVR
jgi:hypothetical protein